MIPIMNAPSASFIRMKTQATIMQATDWYLKALVAVWDAGVILGVDPVVMAAQCAHETGWGHFGGAVTPEMGNLAGIKIRNPKGDAREDHATFPMIDGYPFLGAVAQAHHLRLYAGFPVDLDTTPDPRAVWIKPGTANFGKANYVEDLGGLWAPSARYGQFVATTVQRLRGEIG